MMNFQQFVSESQNAAATEYQKRRQKIDEKIKELRAKLEDHMRRQAADPLNQGYAGDLSRINSHLDDIIASFGP